MYYINLLITSSFDSNMVKISEPYLSFQKINYKNYAQILQKLGRYVLMETTRLYIYQVQGN